jgi:hypothetical protein
MRRLKFAADLAGNLVRPERFELPTYCSGGNRSIHLSYGRTALPQVYMESLTPSMEWKRACSEATPRSVQRTKT